MNSRLFACFALLSSLTLAFAAPASDDVDGRTSHEISSQTLQGSRMISVQLPASYDDQTEFKYPVLYLLDGESNLDYSQAVAEFLAQNAAIPELIIVAVHAGPTRAMDYLPPQPGSPGNADAFLEFIADELQPFIEETYRAAPLRILSGHSYGGVFVTYAMIERPELFVGVLAQSPFLDDRIVGPLVDRARRAFEAPATATTSYYACLGDEPALAGGFAGLEDALANMDSNGVRSSFDAFTEQSHMTTGLIGLHHGLQWIFASEWPLSQSQIMRLRGEGVVHHINGLSESYGYPVLYSESTLQQAIQIFLSMQDSESAVAVSQFYVSQRTQSPIARYLLASSLVKIGDRDSALNAASDGIRLFQDDPRPEWAPLLPALTQLKKQLNADNREE